MNNSKEITQLSILKLKADGDANPKKTNKDVKEMSLEEQTAYYKSLFAKTKKLYLYYEEELKKAENIIKNLKDRLKQYEAEDGNTCEVLFKFTFTGICFYFIKSSENYVTYFIYIIKFFVNEKILEEDFKRLLNSNDNIGSYDYDKDIKQKGKK